ncbi:MAG: peroxide stress protein YaaA [Alphaproteobacteria bacterium]
MLAIVSPAKKLDFSELPQPLPHSLPEFTEQTQSLVKTARRLSRPKLKKLMSLSDTLTELNYQRFQDHAEITSLDNAKQAAFAFAGDTYIGLDSASLTEDDLAFAQDHLRILSGLYGLLRPLDLIQPYRLEMSSRLATRRGKSLYDFWGDKLAQAIDEQVAAHASPVVINLASIEYFKAAQTGRLRARAITPIFKEVSGNQAKVIGFFAKQARGAMARYMIQNRLETPDDLKAFDTDGYRYQDELSDRDNWVFTRQSE